MANIKIIKKITSTVLTFSLVLAGFSFGTLSVYAAGVPLSVAPSVQTVSTTANIVLGFVPAVGMINNSTILVNFPSVYTQTPAILNNADISLSKPGDANFSSAISSAFSSTGFTITLTTAATLNTTSAFSITIGGTNKLQTPVAASNNPFTVSSSAGDFGGALQYVGQANVVQVRARINPTLSFVIRDSNDSANTNVCDFGTVDTSAVYTCAYRLKVGTNAANGFTVAVANSGQFTNGTINIADAAVGTGGAGGSAITAGVEGYGVTITPNTVTGSGGIITLATAYNAGASNAVLYSNTTAATILTANKPNNPTTTSHSVLVTGKIGVNSSTPAGVYTKTETYTVTYNF